MSSSRYPDQGVRRAVVALGTLATALFAVGLVTVRVLHAKLRKGAVMDVVDRGAEVDVCMTRAEFFLVVSLMSEALETGDERDFETRVGASMTEVRELLRSLPELPLTPRGWNG
ncbi:hypothetical protein AB0F07_22005 [Streptomyces fructofermentans]